MSGLLRTINFLGISYVNSIGAKAPGPFPHLPAISMLNSHSLCATLMYMSNNSEVTVRKFERRVMRFALVLLMDSDEGEIRKDGYTVDVSEMGCRVEGLESIAEGQLVRVVPWSTTGDAIEGRVVWVGNPESKLAGEAGIEFLQPLPSQV